MKRIVMLVGMIFLLTFITANNFGYNYLDQGEQVIEGANYSINVNNTNFFDGYSVTGLYNYYKGLLDTAYDLVYCKLTGCTMSGDIDMGGNDIVNAGNVTANYFKGDGSELTGIDQSKWTRTGTTLTPKTSGDDVKIDGKMALGPATIGNSILSVEGTPGDGNSGVGIFSSFEANTGGSAVSGYATPNTGAWTSFKTITSLDYGIFATFQAITGSKLSSTGINIYGFGGLYSSAALDVVKSINVANHHLMVGTYSANKWYGIDIADVSGATIGEQYQLNIAKPTGATNNYQIMLQGNGTGSGIWFDGTTGKRIYSDGTNLVFNTTNGDAYFTRNVSATGFITRTSVLDSEVIAENWIKDRSAYTDSKGDINHELFYGYTPIEVTDFSKPVTIKKEVPYEFELPNGTKIKGTNLVNEVTYPYTKMEDGVNLEYEINILRQRLFEMNEENKDLIKRIEVLENTINFETTGVDIKEVEQPKVWWEFWK